MALWCVVYTTYNDIGLTRPEEISLFLLCAGTPLPSSDCSFLLSIRPRLSPVFRLIVVALGDLAGTLGD
jgi:hypothetical protein